jgi:hypothetical protein
MEKPTKEYPTPLQARGLLLDTNIRVPKEGELMANDDQFTQTIKEHDRSFIQPPEHRLHLV